MKKGLKILRESFYILKDNPKLFIPFILGGAFNGLALYLIYLIPQRPFLYLFGPPVKVFFGERFLHYPFNLYLLPKLFYYATSFVSATIGVLMTALAIGMIKNIYSKEDTLITPNFIYALKRYFALFSVWFVTFIILFFFVKGIRLFPLKLKGLALNIVPYFIYIGTIFIQLLFIYVIPVLIIEKKSIINSFLNGIIFLKKVFPTTLFILGLAIIIYLPVVILRQNMPFLAGAFYPEIIVVVLGISVFVSFVVDVMVTTATTLVFLKEKRG